MSFELFVTNKNAYLYIDNTLVMIFIQINSNSVLVGTEGCAVAFTELEVISRAENLTGYNALIYREEISICENENYTLKQVILG